MSPLEHPRSADAEGRPLARGAGGCGRSRNPRVLSLGPPCQGAQQRRPASSAPHWTGRRSRSEDDALSQGCTRPFAFEGTDQRLRDRFRRFLKPTSITLSREIRTRCGLRISADSPCGCVKKPCSTQESYRKYYRGAVLHSLGSLLSTGIAGCVNHRLRHLLVPASPLVVPTSATDVPQIATCCSHEFWEQQVARPPAPAPLVVPSRPPSIDPTERRRASREAATD